VLSFQPSSLEILCSSSRILDSSILNYRMRGRKSQVQRVDDFTNLRLKEVVLYFKIYLRGGIL